ncbi:MAG: LexA family protein, partial [Chloroflexota bacterium]
AEAEAYNPADPWYRGLVRQDVSDRGLAMLRAIADFHAEHGFVPSHREIGDMAGLSSTSHVAYWLRHLAADGLVTLGSHGQTRSSVVTEAGLWAIEDATLMQEAS